MAKDPYVPFFTGDWIQATRHLTLAARGAWIDLLCFMWTAQNRGTIVESLEGYARRLGASAEQAKRLIDELTTQDSPVAVREDLSDGRIRLTSRRMTRDVAISEARRAAGSKGGCKTVLLKQNVKQNPSKSLDVDMVISSPGGVGGPDPPIVADVPDEIDDAEFAEWPLENQIRHWLNKMPRFPLVNTPPKDVSTLTRMTEKWGWDFVKSCIEKALDNGAERVVPYAQTVAEATAAKAFASKRKPVTAGSKARNWRPG